MVTQNSEATNVSKNLINNYLQDHTTTKLHIGCGQNLLEGWLNTDLAPIHSSVLVLNATEPFPFENSVFDYAFNEHLIEHLPFSGAIHMLRECRRVMKPGARIRIATPDLEQLMKLYQEPLDQDAKGYMVWITRNFLSNLGDVVEPCFVINNAMRNFGHKFIFDFRVLSRLLSELGFTDIRVVTIGTSDDEHLADLENHGKLMGDEAVNRFETMVVEAVNNK